MNEDFSYSETSTPTLRASSYPLLSQCNPLIPPDTHESASFHEENQSDIDLVGLESFRQREYGGYHLKGNGTFKRQCLALLKKNIALQSKKIGTNLCQVVTPLLCLFVLFVVKNMINSKVKEVVEIEMDYPYMFNIPYSRLYNNPLTPVKIKNCLQWYLYDFENATDQTKNFVLGNQSLGLLRNVISPVGNSEKFYHCRSCDKIVPYFAAPINGTINQQIFQDVKYLNGMTYTSDQDTPGLYRLPDGAITFYEASPTNLSFKLQINDLNYPEYHRNNGITKVTVYNPDTRSTSNTMRTSDGELILIDILSKAYLQMINPNVALVSGSQYMPMAGIEANILLKLLSMTEACLYPISLSLLLPVLMHTLVLEKEERLREMMKMNGLKMRNYWITNYFWNLLLYIPSVLIFLLFGIFFLKMPFFTQTNLLILILMLIGWGLSQTSLSFFFQNFFSKSTVVTIILIIVMGYLLSMWTTIVAVALNIAIFPDPQELSWVFRIYPPFAFCRLIYDLCTSCGNGKCITSFNQLTSEMWSCLIILYLGAFLFLFISLYIDQVWPQDYGIAKHPLFFFGNCCHKRKKNKKSYGGDSAKREHCISRLEIDGEDDDVKEERQFVKSIVPQFNEYPLVIKNLRKVYKASGNKPAKIAVKDFCLHINKGEIFGLLGPNGAGKTSLFSMLTGIYTPESGNAWVAGYDILNQIDLVRVKMGFCPQFDLLWPDLTIKEHLLFYARLRGISSSKEEEIVKKAIEEVQLTKFAGFPTKELSGGMKRRLSVAIALVGDPSIIFLDEPTTGLDPENRRQLWDILMGVLAARGDRAMVLTTHSMEEADVLCNRLGIMVQGVLRCIGPQTRLKTLYGAGYHLIINCQSDSSPTLQSQSSRSNNYERLQKFIQELLPGATLKSEFNGNFIFQVPHQGLSLPQTFEKIEERKNELSISDWGISQSTLEDVFMEVVSASEGDPAWGNDEPIL